MSSTCSAGNRIGGVPCSPFSLCGSGSSLRIRRTRTGGVGPTCSYSSSSCFSSCRREAHPMRPPNGARAHGLGCLKHGASRARIAPSRLRISAFDRHTPYSHGKRDRGSQGRREGSMARLHQVAPPRPWRASLCAAPCLPPCSRHWRSLRDRRTWLMPRKSRLRRQPIKPMSRTSAG